MASTANFSTLLKASPLFARLDRATLDAVAALCVSAAAAAPVPAYAAKARDQAVWDSMSTMVVYRKCIGDPERHLDDDYFYCSMLNGN